MKDTFTIQALKEAKNCISTQDEFERDLRYNDSETREEFSRVLGLIDLALEEKQSAADERTKRIARWLDIQVEWNDKLRDKLANALNRIDMLESYIDCLEEAQNF